MLEERSEFANKIKHIDSDVTTGQVTHVKLCHPSICTQTYWSIDEATVWACKQQLTQLY